MYFKMFNSTVRFLAVGYIVRTHVAALSGQNVLFTQFYSTLFKQREKNAQT